MGRKKVFISYAREDGAAAKLLLNALHDAGVATWMDATSLRIGQHFDQEIESAIRTCSVLILLVSAASGQSEYVRFETAAALHSGRTIAPVCLDDTEVSQLPAPLSMKLASVHTMRWSGESDEQLQRLVRDIRTMLEEERGKGRVRLLTVLLLIAAVVVVGAVFWMQQTPPGGQGTIASEAPPVVAPVAKPSGEVPPVQVDDKVSDLPAAEPLRLIYSFPSPASDTPEAATLKFSMRIEAQYGGNPPWRPLKDGDPIASQVDGYRLVLEPATAGHFYVFQLDTLGKAEWLFPENASPYSKGGSNPVRANQSIIIPDPTIHPQSAHGLTLDATVGAEHFYVVFTAARWPELERALMDGGAAAQKLLAQSPSVLPATTVVRSPLRLTTRGVNGFFDDLKKDPSSPVQPLPGTFTYEGKNGLLVVERWLKHVAPPANTPP